MAQRHGLHLRATQAEAERAELMEASAGALQEKANEVAQLNAMLEATASDKLKLEHELTQARV